MNECVNVIHCWMADITVSDAPQAALLAGRRHSSEVTAQEFDSAILRAIAGVEKKRSILMGKEKSVVAKHEVSSLCMPNRLEPILCLRESMALMIRSFLRMYIVQRDGPDSWFSCRLVMLWLGVQFLSFYPKCQLWNA